MSNAHLDPQVHVAQADDPDDVAEAGVPIGEPLSCRVRLDRQDGRKLYMNGELTIEATGQVPTRSTATFIAIDPSRFAPVVATR